MKKVLILAYNFPPSTRTSANRTKAWAMYMHEFGYYPIIVTRHWDKKSQITFKDDNKECGSSIVVEKHATYEVHYLPYKPIIRERLLVNNANKLWFKLFSKLYSFIKLFGIFYFNVFIPYSNFQKYAATILKKDKTITKMVVTVFPVFLLKFAHTLSKKYAIKWIADYRDDWNTSEVIKKTGINNNKKIQNLSVKSEKKWLKSASFVTSVSDGYVKRLVLFLNKKGKGTTLTNGFFEEEMEAYKNIALYDNFTITYNGTLYKSQPIEIFMEAVKKLILNYPDQSITIRFPGITNEVEAEKKIKQLSSGIEEHIITSDRIPKNEVLKMQAKSHLVLMVGHIGIEDIPSSKIYEYIGLNKKVLICPSDNGVIKDTLTDVGIALNANTAKEAYSIMENELLNINNLTASKINQRKTYKYSRRYQTKLLCNLLDKM